MEFLSQHLSGVVSFYSASGYRLEICLSFYSTDIAARLLELKGGSLKKHGDVVSSGSVGKNRFGNILRYFTWLYLY